MRSINNKSTFICVYRNYNSNTFYFESKISDNFSSNKRHKESGFKSLEEAYAAKLAYEQYAIKAKKEKSLKFLINDYLEYKKPLIKLSSHYSLKLMMNKYLKEYKNYSCNEFANKVNLIKFRNKLLTSTLCNEWKNKILKMIRNLYEYGTYINIVSQETYNLVRLNTNKIVQTFVIKKRHDPRDNYLSLDEWKRFLSVIKDDKWKLFFILFGQLGCRIGEIRGLQNKHVLVDSNEIRIEQQATDKCGAKTTIITTTKTPSSNRTVSISKSLVELLKRYIENNDPNNFLFFNNRAPIGSQTIRRKFNEYLKLAKLHYVTIHGIRHSNCTWLLSENLTPQEIGQVSRRLGHSSIKITLDIYMGIHKIEDPLITNKLDNLI